MFDKVFSKDVIGAIKWKMSKFFDEAPEGRESLLLLLKKFHSYSSELFIALHNIKIHENNLDEISHYTSLINFEKILNERRLLLNINNNLNDLNEGNSHWKTDKLCNIISFTNQKDSIALWGNYTQFSGVAIVFYKEKIVDSLSNFVSELGDQIEVTKVNANFVMYGKNESNKVQKDIFDFFSTIEFIPMNVSEHMSDVLMKAKEENAYYFKDEPWRYESEFRIIVNHQEKTLINDQYKKSEKSSFSFEGERIFNSFNIEDIKEVVISPKLAKSKIVATGIIKLIDEINKKEKTSIKVKLTDSNLRV